MQRKPGTDRVGSFGGQGLASNLPPAGDVGRKTYEDRELDIKYPPRGEDAWRKGNTNDVPPAQSGSSGPSSGWKSARSSEPADDVNDKWSKVFGSKSSAPKQEEQAPLRMNDRNFGSSGEGGGSRSFGGNSNDARNFGGSDRPRDDRFSSFNRGPREGGDRGEPRGDRPTREPFGGDRPAREPFGGPRDGPRDFGGPRDGPREPFGGSRDGPRGDSFGGPRDGPRDGPPRGPRRGGERDSEWMDDPRFASKFGGGKPREGGGGDRGERRPRGEGGFGDRDDRRNDGDRYGGKFGRDSNPRFNDREVRSKNDPLPTAPRASLATETRPDPDAARIAAEKVKAAAEEETRKKEEAKKEKADKAAKKKADEEEARRVKAEKEAAAKEALQRAQNAKINTYNATVEAIKTGLTGDALTKALKESEKEHLSAAGVMKGVLASLQDNYTATKWCTKELYGDVLLAIQPTATSLPEREKVQIDLLYAVQEFCYEKNFPKLDAKSPKTLIASLFTFLLNGQIIEAENVIAWADDTNEDDVKGRATAIVQTTTMVQMIRDALAEDEEEEVEIDDDLLLNPYSR